MNIRPEEVSSIIKKEIDNYKKSLEIKTSGTVLEVGDGIARIFGLSNVMSGELLEFPHGVMGMALNLEEDNVGAVILGNASLIKEGDEVRATGKVVSVPAGENLNILLYILDKGRMNCIKYIVAEYLKIYYRKNRILDVKATFTKELTDEQKKKLINKLSQKTGKEINLEIKIDKDILGGGIIKIGDKIIDGSIRRELDNWKKS